jgi:hypothetical protein
VFYWISWSAWISRYLVKKVKGSEPSSQLMAPNISSLAIEKSLRLWISMQTPTNGKWDKVLRLARWTPVSGFKRDSARIMSLLPPKVHKRRWLKRNREARATDLNQKLLLSAKHSWRIKWDLMLIRRYLVIQWRTMYAWNLITRNCRSYIIKDQEVLMRRISFIGKMWKTILIHRTWKTQPDPLARMSFA